MFVEVLQTDIYKDYVGTYKWNEEAQIYHGRLDNIEHVITFKGETLSQLEADFKDAVDDYIECCKL